MTKNSQNTVSRKKRREQLAEERKQRNRRYGLMGLMSLVLIVGILFFISQRTNENVADEFEGELAGIAYDGSPNAPVQIVEFGDFGCHSCRAWHNAHIKTLLKSQFGDQIAFQFRHFPVITDQSPMAAAAGQCALEQNTQGFWAYHDYIYEVTAQGALSKRDLKRYAADVDLDTVAFDQCLDSGRYTNYVRQELQDARDMGARGTPTFLINGQQVNFSADAMSAAISAILDG